MNELQTTPSQGTAGDFSFARKFLKNLFGFSVSTWVSCVVSFISTPIITRLFLPDEIGRINLFTTYLTLLMSVSYLGLDQAYMRFFNDPPPHCTKRRLLSICISCATYACVGISVLILIFRKFISSHISSAYNWIVPVCLVLSLFANVWLRFYNVSYRMNKRAVLFSVQAILLTVIGKLLYVIVAFWKANHTYAILAMTAGYVLTAVFFYWFQGRHLLTLHIDRASATPLFRFGLPLMPITLLSILNNSIAQLMLSAFTTYADIGIYTNAVSLSGILSLLQSGFNAYWMPFVYENYKDRREKLTRMHALITLGMIAFGLLIMIGQDPLYLILGEKFRAGKSFFPLLLVSPVCYTIAETTGLGINISKKSYLNIVTFVCNTSVNLLLCLLLLPVIGVTGAAVASAASAVVMLTIKTVLGEKHYRCVDNYRRTFFSLFLFVCMCAVNVVLDGILWRTLLYTLALAAICLLYRGEIRYLFRFAKDLFSRKKR